MKKPNPKSSQKVSFLDRIHAPVWMVGILALVFLLRLPSLFEPYYYGDEMIYLNLGEAIKRGMVLYRDIHDNKPPLLYFTAALAGNVFWFRAILVAWSLGAVFVFWRLARNLFSKEHTLVKISTLIFAIFSTIPLLEGQIANAENFMIGTTVLAMWILFRFKNNFLNVFTIGVLLSLSTLFKIPAAFDILAIVFIWFALTRLNKKSIFGLAKNILYLSAGFFIPILITIFYYFLRGALNEYLVGAFLQNIGYLSTWRPDAVVEPFLVRNGPLVLRFGIMSSTLLLLYVYKKRLTKEFIFCSAWLVVGLFAATLSERPYPHYMLQIVPPASLLLGMLISRKTIEQSLAILPLSLVFIATVYFKFWYYPTFSYYQRFIGFATEQISKEEYFNSFDPGTTRNYKLAEFLLSSSRKDDKVFVWGDSPTIYALAHRLPPIKYVATYHVNDFSSREETVAELQKNLPLYIVLLPNSEEFSQLYPLINTNYYLVHETDGARIYKKFSFN